MNGHAGGTWGIRSRAKKVLHRDLAAVGSLVLSNGLARSALKTVLVHGWLHGGRYSSMLFERAAPAVDFVWEHEFLGRVIRTPVTPALPLSWRAAWLLEV